MNKRELIDAVAEQTGVSKEDVGAVIDGLFAEVSKVVAQGEEKVTITGFVSFERVERKARRGFNPQSGEPIAIPGSATVRVTAGQALKRAAAEGPGWTGPKDEA